MNSICIKNPPSSCRYKDKYMLRVQKTEDVIGIATTQPPRKKVE